MYTTSPSHAIRANNTRSASTSFRRKLSAYSAVIDTRFRFHLPLHCPASLVDSGHLFEGGFMSLVES